MDWILQGEAWIALPTLSTLEIVLGVDSVMSGDSLVRLVQLMEMHTTAGMIQTVPSPVYRRSIYGRVQQFAARAYGPMFTAGLPPAWRDGFARAVADPVLQAVHRSTLGRPRHTKATIHESRRLLVDRVVADGPARTDDRARRIVLGNPDVFDEVHTRVWATDDDDVARRWGVAG